ncbi:uncharacterized protein LOC133196772 [Saccostrea echinata]|uniref:uncharacterized protein LOC133196772 n=2 Tax=Saccostrea echinata TaxID=191078 RepID=UPI002A838282|nr:uncharacterized protein LOC133196772 [Saccostrea echinata]
MGLFQSCLRNNKVGILSDEEEAAYKKIQEVNKEMAHDQEKNDIQTLPEMMFCVTPIKAHGDTSHDHDDNDLSPDAIEKTELMNSTYKSSVPTLPPLVGQVKTILVLDLEDENAYVQWEEESERILVEKGFLKKDKNKLTEQRRKQLLRRNSRQTVN